MDTTIQCPHCTKDFTPSSSRHKFCSKECRHTHWVEANREKLNECVRKYRKRRYEKEGRWRDEGDKARHLKAWMIEIKSKPCTDCKNKFPICCMDFDHRIGTKKEYNVASMFAHHYSRELIEKELAKCDLVCANCHRIRTRDRRTGNGNNNPK
jgi:hypothetical protein